MATPASRQLVTKVATAWVQLREQLVLTDRPFKINRTQGSAGTPTKLVARYTGEYPDEKILSAQILLVDTPQNVAAAEKALISVAWNDFPGRCINEQLGGGDLTEEEQHAVYAITFQKSDTLINKAWESAFLRILTDG